MSASTAFLGPVDSVSALRCGFASLKPISVRETIRKWGLKLTTVRWQFEGSASNNDWVKSYPSYVKLLNSAVLERVKLPETVDSQMLADMLTKTSIEQFEKDHELKSALAKVESEKESAGPFMTFTRFLRKRFEEKRAGTVQAKAEMFMHSNLPFSYFSDLVMSNEIYEGFLDALQRKLGLYESVWFKRAYNNPEQFKRKFREMQASLSPLFDVMERTLFSEKCLNVLVFGSNCKGASSLFSIDFLDIEKIDYAQFERLTHEFDSNLNSCVSLIVSMEPNSFSRLPNTDLNKVFSELLV
jgi:hypothetical protein